MSVAVMTDIEDHSLVPKSKDARQSTGAWE